MTVELKNAKQKIEEAIAKQEAEKKTIRQLRTLLGDPNFLVYCGLIDSLAMQYMNQLMAPNEKEFHAHYLRGILKGLDVAKSLPFNTVRGYDQKQAAIQADLEKKQAGEQDNPERRLSPEPEEAPDGRGQPSPGLSP